MRKALQFLTPFSILAPQGTPGSKFTNLVPDIQQCPLYQPSKFRPFLKTPLLDICCQTSSISLMAWSTQKQTVNDIVSAYHAATMNDTWWYELNPRQLINVAALPCESQNIENVVLQQEITTENCIRCIIASSRWTRVIMWLTFTYLGCHTAMCVWNKVSWHQRPAKTLDVNLVWLWPEHHWHCD